MAGKTKIQQDQKTFWFKSFALTCRDTLLVQDWTKY